MKAEKLPRVFEADDGRVFVDSGADLPECACRKPSEPWKFNGDCSLSGAALMDDFSEVKDRERASALFHAALAAFRSRSSIPSAVLSPVMNDDAKDRVFEADDGRLLVFAGPGLPKRACRKPGGPWKFAGECDFSASAFMDDFAPVKDSKRASALFHEAAAALTEQISGPETAPPNVQPKANDTRAKKIIRQVATRVIAQNRSFWDDLKSDFKMGALPDLMGSYLGSVFAAAADRELGKLSGEDQMVLRELTTRRNTGQKVISQRSPSHLVVGEIMLRAERVASRW